MPLQLSAGGSENDEEWWAFVRSQFTFRENLLYFNNGSLGPSPEYVINKTEVFRRTLDSFLSKYMWGGWNDYKERVRQLISDNLSVDREEIAITHNTSEGMNLFARSFDVICPNYSALEQQLNSITCWARRESRYGFIHLNITSGHSLKMTSDSLSRHR